jgi:hypothetical protein
MLMSLANSILLSLFVRMSHQFTLEINNLHYSYRIFTLAGLYVLALKNNND